MMLRDPRELKTITNEAMLEAERTVGMPAQINSDKLNASVRLLLLLRGYRGSPA